MSATADGAERRRYFRIDDEIVLSYQQVPAGEVPEHHTFREHEPDVFSLASHLELLSAESATLLRRIERDDPVLGDYLRFLEQKIDLIARSLLANEEEFRLSPAQRVNLSAAGLSFLCTDEFAAGAVLELKLILPPALIGIRAYGRVVYCRYRGGDAPSYQIGVDFIGLRDQDRDLLIRHIIKKQSQQLREHRQEPPTGGD
jgi:c-di-GMP-binding flagellar brake protein YcgR